MNMGSAREHPEVVSEYLAKELALGRMLGQFPKSASVAAVHINRFGVIPKGHNTGGGSSPTSRFCVVTASATEMTKACAPSRTPPSTKLVARLGQAALLTKMDIESAPGYGVGW